MINQTDSLTPGKSEEKIANAEDVRNLYNLLHRRNPESDRVIDTFCGKTFVPLYSAVLNSPEFYKKILQPLTIDQAIWGPYRGSTSFSDLLRWATTALPAGPDFWRDLAPDVGWEDFYLALLLDVRTKKFNSKLGEPSIRAALQMRLHDSKLNAHRNVVGQQGVSPLADRVLRIGRLSDGAGLPGSPQTIPREELPDDEPCCASHPAHRRYDDTVLATIAERFDSGFYLTSYPDVRAAGVDPVVHYHQHGWSEGRNPNAWFSTIWYIRQNPDVRASKLDPFFHYLVSGEKEGRQPSLRQVEAVELQQLVLTICRGARGLILSASHSCYVHVTGGIQNVIGDEQRLFNADRLAYLHISPAIATTTLVPEVSESAQLEVVINGHYVVLANSGTLEAALHSLTTSTYATALRIFVVHSVLGHRATVLSRLAAALAPRHSFFWLHDYSALCEGYTLMRNDIAYCSAPPPESTACMVCVYGPTRNVHRRALTDLFNAVPFHVVAPSRVALDIYLRAGRLPHLTERVHEHALFVPHRKFQRTARGTVEDPIRIAFAGYPVPHKGWPLFLRLVQHVMAQAHYKFYQFAEAASLTPMDGLTCIAVRVGPHDRFAMINSLAAQEIDFVVVLSPWPETFCYVAHEAFAAGADVVTLSQSGNAASAVKRYGRGVVLADEKALLRFFGDGQAVDYERQRADDGIAKGNLLYRGSIATIDLSAEDPVDTERFVTDDPDLVVLAGDQIICPERIGAQFTFSLTGRTGPVRLLSRHYFPSFQEVDGVDPRRLGVGVVLLTLDGELIPPDDLRRGAGWYPPDDGIQWTNGDAILEPGPARVLQVILQHFPRYWRVPLAAS